MIRTFYCVGCQKFKPYIEAIEVANIGFQPFGSPEVEWKRVTQPLHLCESCTPLIKENHA